MRSTKITNFCRCWSLLLLCINNLSAGSTIYKIIGVSQHDSLNIRMEANQKSAIVGKIPSNAGDVKVDQLEFENSDVWCRGTVW